MVLGDRVEKELIKKKRDEFELASNSKEYRNMMEKLFESKTHQAYERRKQNDRVIDTMGHRFMKDCTEEEKLNRMHEEYTAANNARISELESEKRRHRREREAEMKAVLDKQV